MYLAQEGRGIGLVNKLRAYALQERGFDTMDANEQLGFDADERVYQPAARMLRHLGFKRIRLMTNNTDKVAALAASGVVVSERVRHAFPSNKHKRGLPAHQGDARRPPALAPPARGGRNCRGRLSPCPAGESEHIDFIVISPGTALA